MADDAAADSIASKVFEEEQRRTPSGFAFVDYEKPFDQALADMEAAMSGETRYNVDEGLSEEEAAIERKAKADGSWMTAPNGERSRLAPRQWLQTRTKAFKKWFGDWVLALQKDFLMNGEPVSSIEGKKIIAKEGQTFIDAVTELFAQQGGKADSPFGEVLLDRNAVKNDRNHGIGAIKNITFASVKDVLEHGMVLMFMARNKRQVSLLRQSR